jgi:hypothetical protein
MYIPTGIKRQLLRFGVNCDSTRKIVKIVSGGSLNIHLAEKLLLVSLWQGVEGG